MDHETHLTQARHRRRYTLGAGAVLHDGSRILTLIGVARGRGGRLIVELDVAGVIEQVSFEQLCRETTALAPLAPACEIDDVESLPEWAALPEHTRRRAVEDARHLRQVLTGSPDGNLARARLLGVVDARYDPTLVPLRERITAKADELKAAGRRGFSEQSIYRKLRRKAGADGVDLIDLVDARTTRKVDPLSRVEPEVIDVVRRVVAERIGGAQLTTRKLTALARFELNRVGLEVRDRDLPSIVHELSRGHALHRPARSRQTHANRPSGVGGRMPATRPGEIVQIDATPSNAHAWFPDYGWGPATILTGIDVYTRQILALRVVPAALTTRDSALLLWDMSRANVSRSGWPWRLRRWHGIPSLVLIDVDRTCLPNELKESARTIGTKQPVLPSTVVIDHGSEFDAEHFQSVCARNGIDVLFARPRTPTDKAIVESWHYTLDQALRTLPGYKGANPQDHPAGAEDEAALTCADLQDMLWTWILTVYHDSPHSGLRDPANPAITLSPNMMFDRFLSVGGHIDVPTDPYRVIGFLSSEERTVQDDGIHVNNRTFISDDLVELIPRMQRGTGASARKLAVYYDRWDMTRIYYRHPFEHRWVCLPVAAPGGAAVAPFSEALTRQAIRDHLHGARPVNNTELEQREQRLLANWNAGVFHPLRERRTHGFEEARQTSYARDIADWGDEMRDLAFPRHTQPQDGLDGYDDAEADDDEVFEYGDDEVDGLAL